MFEDKKLGKGQFLNNGHVISWKLVNVICTYIFLAFVLMHSHPTDPSLDSVEMKTEKICVQIT